MFFQTTVRVNVDDRYVAHVELDRIYKGFSREKRGWRHAIVDAGPAGFWALLRTYQEEIVKASPMPRAWDSMSSPGVGKEVTLVLQFTPKGVQHFSRFFESDEFALEQVRSRLTMLDRLHVELLSRQHIWISKRSNAYSAPSAFFHIQGRVQDADAYAKLLCTGIGGSLAFGLGLPITPDCALYELATAVAQAEA